MESPAFNPSEASRQHAVTALLRQMQDGDPEAINRLMPLIYDELHALAHRKLRYERTDHTLNTTALVHEAYLKLVNQQAAWQSRTHFMAIAAQAMRRILAQYARNRKALKRGGGQARVSVDLIDLEAPAAMSEEQADEVLALDAALTRLEQFNERGCRVVEYRVFGGLTHEEAGEAMGLSEVTVRRAWKAAKAWLRHEMKEIG